MNPTARPTVLVVYQHLPHYRDAVFQLMADSTRINYHFLASPVGENGIRTISFGNLRNTHALRNIWVGPFLIQRGLQSKIREIRPDVIIFLGDYRYLTTWYSAYTERRRGTRIFFWTQGWRHQEAGLRAGFRRTFYRLADHLFVYGNHARNHGIAAGFPPDFITAIGNSNVAAANLGLLRVDKIPSPTLRLGAVMRLTPSKKAGQLIEIAQLLNKRGITTEVHLAGDGSEVPHLLEASEAVKVPLRMYGEIHKPHELARFYSEIDVCVIPGAAGLSILQALSHGRPVVTNNTMSKQGPETEAIIPAYNGSLVPEDDLQAFAQAVYEWGNRMKDDSDTVTRHCAESLGKHWVADQQANLIERAILSSAPSKLRLAVLNPNATGQLYSGPNTFMERLFSNNESFDVSIVTGHVGARTEFPWAKVITPTTYDRSGRVAQLKWTIALTRWLWRNSANFDVIHAHGIYLFNLLPLVAAQARRVPTILVPLGSNAELGFTNDPNRRQRLVRIRKAIIARATIGLALSKLTERELIAAGLDNRRVRTVGNPVDTSYYCPPPNDSRVELRTIGFVGALSNNKGPDVVLKALAILKATPGWENVRGLFVGPFYDRHYEREFYESAVQLGLENQIEVVGFTQSVLEQMHRMTIFVLPSRQEGLPGSLVEALATGLPAIVTDVGAMGDVIREADAGRVTPRDPHLIASAILETSRTTTWRRLSVNARNHALENYSLPAVQLDYLDSVTFATNWRR
ncbi:glycosyltransferase family 4 protein [Janibacter anophelis]|uniref:glycosyltransferase family 4 protein n=1 Tax=Janibacter anophelis TaxID=319054 RepID=UPI000B15B70C|nr:glycosyltransferase family 4 protein [Janibacter anophelis]